MTTQSAPNQAAIDLLNQILQIEYSIIVHYPRFVKMLKDTELKNYARTLGTASVAHADTVAATIRSLGGTPIWSFGAPPDSEDVIPTFETQLEKEREVEQLHKKAAGLMRNPELKSRFLQLAGEEVEHAALVEKILLILQKNV